ncbi:2OG-Fe(II) oxygenase [Protofrankia symbiont of Coriaria ruscifolia]|uniref:2OG-Fe(II) oxygenase n=1 Tax=Protofrankia symbiont of Coriaria ruscifolia TaxID=1306542 RepID=UPI0010415911|nr:2OG-Fe(II) oxygenase [Protofrankia symbiont of Coriaria ruscifolia]
MPQTVFDYYFDRETLQPLAEKYRVSFQTAQPFRHVVIDDFLPAEILHEVVNAFPKPGDADWQRFDASQEVKLALADEVLMPTPLRHVLQQFNSGPFLDFLEDLTGISGLLPDPHLVGGGLHQIVRGGFLKVHADFNRHRRLGVDRRLNILLYLNEDWDESWGGHLELWDRGMTRAVHRIAPLFNRFVVFATTDHSYHGHPDPLRSPEGVTRRSLAWYYYTNGRPADEVSPDHTTLFQARPGEAVRPSGLARAQDIARRATPPLLIDAARTLRSRRQAGH